MLPIVEARMLASMPLVRKTLRTFGGFRTHVGDELRAIVGQGAVYELTEAFRFTVAGVTRVASNATGPSLSCQNK